MRFNSSLAIDFNEWNRVQMERENNVTLQSNGFKEETPSLGAGTEYGKEQRAEARRRRSGTNPKNHKPEDQPWMIQHDKTGKTGAMKKYRGVREGGVTDNASYYVLTQAGDGVLDAFPVQEWYSFQATQRYEALSYEEAEEQFNSRKRSLNIFNVMARKRMSNDGDNDENGNNDHSAKKSLKSDLCISAEWGSSSSDNGDSNNEDDPNYRRNRKQVKRRVKAKRNRSKSLSESEEEEPAEDSDDGDGDGKEVDYLDSTEEDDNDVQLDGVNDLVTISDDDSDTEEKGKEKYNKSRQEDCDSPSESDGQSWNQAKASQPIIATQPMKPIVPSVKPVANVKRKVAISTVIKEKQVRVDALPGLPAILNGKVNEKVIRRYLCHKPMTITELVTKFKRMNLNVASEQLVTFIAAVLKKINPVKRIINGKMTFSLNS